MKKRERGKLYPKKIFEKKLEKMKSQIGRAFYSRKEGKLLGNFVFRWYKERLESNLEACIDKIEKRWLLYKQLNDKNLYIDSSSLQELTKEYGRETRAPLKIYEVFWKTPIRIFIGDDWDYRIIGYMKELIDEAQPILLEENNLPLPPSTRWIVAKALANTEKKMKNVIQWNFKTYTPAYFKGIPSMRKTRASAKYIFVLHYLLQDLSYRFMFEGADKGLLSEAGLIFADGIIEWLSQNEAFYRYVRDIKQWRAIKNEEYEKEWIKELNENNKFLSMYLSLMSGSILRGFKDIIESVAEVYTGSGEILNVFIRTNIYQNVIYLFESDGRYDVRVLEERGKYKEDEKETT